MHKELISLYKISLDFLNKTTILRSNVRTSKAILCTILCMILCITYVGVLKSQTSQTI